MVPSRKSEVTVELTSNMNSSTSSSSDPETISLGDWVLVQRQDYMKLCKVKANGVVRLGALKVRLSGVVGHRFFDSFQLRAGAEETHTLVKVEPHQVQARCARSVGAGSDNRHIVDDGKSQALSKTQIEALRASASSADVLEQLIAHSRTFAQKTEFSQAKYVRRKQRKHCDVLTIRRPSIRLLADVGGALRADDLGQMLAYGNVQAGGAYAVYDSCGSRGLLPAAVLERVGRATAGHVVFVHPGNQGQAQALLAMRFPAEQAARCVPVNSYSVLRWLHQHIPETHLEDDPPEAKRAKRPQWHAHNAAACAILRQGVDGVLVASREHPLAIANELLPLLKPSRNLVAFHAIREPLQDLYLALVARADVANVRLSSTFMRHYQVLPERTHPMVTMTSGGYLLTATKLHV